MRRSMYLKVTMALIKFKIVRHYSRVRYVSQEFLLDKFYDLE